MPDILDDRSCAKDETGSPSTSSIPKRSRCSIDSFVNLNSLSEEGISDEAQYTGQCTAGEQPERVP